MLLLEKTKKQAKTLSEGCLNTLFDDFVPEFDDFIPEFDDFEPLFDESVPSNCPRFVSVETNRIINKNQPIHLSNFTYLKIENYETKFKCFNENKNTKAETNFRNSIFGL